LVVWGCCPCSEKTITNGGKKNSPPTGEKHASQTWGKKHPPKPNSKTAHAKKTLPK